MTLIANLMLLSAGAIWGGAFVVMKNALDSISTNYLLAARFFIGAAGLSYTLFSRKHPVSRDAVIGGIVTGAMLYGAFAVQTYGLMYTTAGKNALITASYVVLVPFLQWLIRKKRPEGRTVLAAGIMLSGIALLTLDGGSGLNIGDFLTLLCGLGYALHMIYVDKYSRRADVLQLTCIQFSFAALMSFVAALIFEEPPAAITTDMGWALAYCGVAATLVAMTFQNVGIKYASPEYSSLLLSTEAAFGCVFGVLFLHDPMTGKMWAGCGLILGALVLSQVDWDSVMHRSGRKGALSGGRF